LADLLRQSAKSGAAKPRPKPSGGGCHGGVHDINQQRHHRAARTRLRAAANSGSFSTQILFPLLQAKPTSMVRLALALHLTTLIEIDRSGGLKSSYRLAV